MAEAFGVASGALQVADAGLKLAKTLYNYLDAVRKADKELQVLAREVTVTSSTLSSLGNLLKEQNAKRLYTEDLVSEAKVAFDGCRAAFTEVDVTFRSVVRFDSDGKPMVTGKGRWAWPLKKGNVEMLQANLERLKTTLLLMLSVLSFARETAQQPAIDDTRVAVEKLQIENLIKAQQDANERYDQLVTIFQKLATDVKPSQNITNIAVGIFATTQSRSLTDGSQTQPGADPDPTDEISRHLSSCAEAVSRLSSMLSSAGTKWQSKRQLDINTIQESLSHIVNGVQCLHESHVRSTSQIVSTDSAARKGEQSSIADLNNSTITSPGKISWPEPSSQAATKDTSSQEPSRTRGGSSSLPILNGSCPDEDKLNDEEPKLRRMKTRGSTKAEILRAIKAERGRRELLQQKDRNPEDVPNIEPNSARGTTMAKFVGEINVLEINTLKLKDSGSEATSLSSRQDREDSDGTTVDLSLNTEVPSAQEELKLEPHGSEALRAPSSISYCNYNALEISPEDFIYDEDEEADARQQATMAQVEEFQHTAKRKSVLKTSGRSSTKHPSSHIQYSRAPTRRRSLDTIRPRPAERVEREEVVFIERERVRIREGEHELPLSPLRMPSGGTAASDSPGTERMSQSVMVERLQERQSLWRTGSALRASEDSNKPGNGLERTHDIDAGAIETQEPAAQIGSQIMWAASRSPAAVSVLVEESEEPLSQQDTNKDVSAADALLRKWTTLPLA